MWCTTECWDCYDPNCNQSLYYKGREFMFKDYPSLNKISKDLRDKYRNKSEEQFLKDLSEDLYHYEVMLYLQEANLKRSEFYKDYKNKNQHSHPGYCHIYTVYNRMKKNREEAKKAIEKHSEGIYDENLWKAKELLEEDLL